MTFVTLTMHRGESHKLLAVEHVFQDTTFIHVLFVVLTPSELKLLTVISLKQGNQSETDTGAFQKTAI